MVSEPTGRVYLYSRYMALEVFGFHLYRTNERYFQKLQFYWFIGNISWVTVSLWFVIEVKSLRINWPVGNLEQAFYDTGQITTVTETFSSLQAKLWDVIQQPIFNLINRWKWCEEIFIIDIWSYSIFLYFVTLLTLYLQFVCVYLLLYSSLYLFTGASGKRITRYQKNWNKI